MRRPTGRSPPWPLAGSALSLLVLAGATNALLQLVLWAIYLSFVQVGQIFYGYGSIMRPSPIPVP